MHVFWTSWLDGSFLAVDTVFRFQSSDPCDVESVEHVQMSRAARAAPGSSLLGQAEGMRRSLGR